MEYIIWKFLIIYAQLHSNKINYNVNIDELDKKQDLYLYPNPFVSQAVLDLSKFQIKN